MRDHAAEWLVGVGWTFVGTGGLVIALGWLFVILEPRNTPAAVFSWIGLSIAAFGLALAVGSFGFGVQRDAILRAVLVATLVMGAGVFTFGLLLPGQQEQEAPPAALPASAFRGEEGETEAPNDP